MVIPNNNEWSEVEPRFADHHANTDNNSEDVMADTFLIGATKRYASFGMMLIFQSLLLQNLVLESIDIIDS